MVEFTFRCVGKRCCDEHFLNGFMQTLLSSHYQYLYYLQIRRSRGCVRPSKRYVQTQSPVNRESSHLGNTCQSLLMSTVSITVAGSVWDLGCFIIFGKLHKWVFTRSYMLGLVTDLQRNLCNKLDDITASLMRSRHIISNSNYSFVINWIAVYVKTNFQ